MSQHFKFIIPLLSDEITLDDLSYDAGFIDAFSYDINRPYLANHIFLLYLAKTDTSESYNRMIKFKTLDNLYNETEIIIKGVLCKLYTFCITKKAISHILENVLLLNNTDVERIMLFWKCTDKDVNQYMIDRLHYRLHNYELRTVPEQDYVKTCTRVHKKTRDSY